ncbi:MAG: adenosylcobinamide-GDP ribazoletransferase, partial [Candidatus Acidiferrales bacterium]
VLMSGALHLDGLADSADAWAGGRGDRERSLAIMKDPACGPAGAVALIVVLLIKLSALEALAAQQLPLVLAPMLGRGALLALFLTTPYVRPGGLGEVHARALPRRPAVIVVLVVVAAPMTIGSDGLWMLASVFTTFMLMRAAMLRRLGGATGDTAGAVVEITESAVLITAAMV